MRILLITYFFQPVQNVCADRPNSLFKYARACGVDIDVITTGSPQAGDEGQNIFRVANIDGWNKRPLSVRKLIAKLLTKIIDPFFFNIDFFWYSNTVTFFHSQLPTRHYDALYAVYPHITALLVGLRLSKRYGIPLFTDFTDCMGVDPLVQPRHLLQKMLHFSFEKNTVQSSQGIFTIAEAYERYYRHRFGKAAAWNVYNGFDPDDYARLEPPVNANKYKVTIVLFGNICASRERDVTPLFSAIAKLKTVRGVSPKDIEFLFIGRHTESERAARKAFDVEDIVQFLPYMDKREGFKRIVGTCDYLLHYGISGASSSVCSKVLEYLRLYKPILGICKGNEAEGIITRAGAGEIAAFEADDIMSLFSRALDRSVRYAPNIDYIESFSRAAQANFIFDRIRECLPNQ